MTIAIKILINIVSAAMIAIGMLGMTGVTGSKGFIVATILIIGGLDLRYKLKIDHK